MISMIVVIVVNRCGKFFRAKNTAAHLTESHERIIQFYDVGSFSRSDEEADEAIPYLFDNLGIHTTDKMIKETNQIVQRTWRTLWDQNTPTYL